MNRRRLLRALAGGGVVAGLARAVDNVLVGYGSLGLGTNLHSQDLARVADRGFGRPDTYAVRTDGHRVVLDGDTLRVRTADGRAVGSLTVAGATPEAGAALDEEAGLSAGPVEQLVADVRALEAGRFEFAFQGYEAFFERVGAAESRPFTTGLVRGDSYREVAPSTVAAFADADPARPRAVIERLVGAFRAHTSYDFPRYVAGSIQDNVLFGAADLRAGFRADVDFESLLSRERSGLFCYEFVRRSIEALHAVPAHRQRPPVVGARVIDNRHKHVYTAVASVVREGGDLVVPVTFVDYTHTTMYDDLDLTGVLGEGLDAYDRRHRADEIWW